MYTQYFQFFEHKQQSIQERKQQQQRLPDLATRSLTKETQSKQNIDD